MNLDGIQAPTPEVKEEAQEQSQEQPKIKGKLLDFDSASEWGDNVHFVEKGEETEEPAADEVVEEEEPEVEVEEEAPEPVPLVDDPGEFVPSDYSFDVTVYDAEGKSPKTVNIQSPEQWDNLLDGDPNLGSASALLKAQRAASRMEISQENDKQKWQEKKDAFSEYSAGVAQQTQALETMASEIEYLVSKGDLPRVANQFKNGDWQDPEVAKQNGVKEQIELLSYMRKENKARIKAGLKPMSSVLDAFNASKLDSSRKQSTDTKKVAGEERKAASARVAGTTPNPVNVAPKGIMVGRVGAMSQSDWNL